MAVFLYISVKLQSCSLSIVSFNHSLMDIKVVIVWDQKGFEISKLSWHGACCNNRIKLSGTSSKFQVSCAVRYWRRIQSWHNNSSPRSMSSLQRNSEKPTCVWLNTCCGKLEFSLVWWWLWRESHISEIPKLQISLTRVTVWNKSLI